MPVMSGKHAFLELLKQEGVEIVFGNPGTTELPLMDAFATENEIRYVLGLQEAAVMAMADGYAQASGKLTVCNFHTTPGLGNAMGMLYDAQKAGAPILVTAGQHEQTFNVTEPILMADLPPIARPLVKWSTEVHRLADLPRIVHRAAKTALAPPTGPVFLSLPGDILRADADLDLMAPTRIAPHIRGDRAAVEAAAAILAQAERPIIMAGDIVAQSRAHAELIELAELIGAPVYHRVHAEHGVVSELASAVPRPDDTHRPGHARKCSTSTTCCSRSAPTCSRCRCRPTTDPMPPGIALIHLDVDPWEIGKNYPPKVAILGDPKGTLPDLTAALRERMSSGAKGAARDRLKTASDDGAAERAAAGRESAFARERGAGAAAGAAARHRRDAAEGCSRGRGGAVLQPAASGGSSAPTIRRAISACAAAASAGACRRPSASSLRCRTGRWSASSATAPRSTPSRRCGPRRATGSGRSS